MLKTGVRTRANHPNEAPIVKLLADELLHFGVLGDRVCAFGASRHHDEVVLALGMSGERRHDRARTCFAERSIESKVVSATMRTPREHVAMLDELAGPTSADVHSTPALTSVSYVIVLDVRVSYVIAGISACAHNSISSVPLAMNTRAFGDIVGGNEGRYDVLCRAAPQYVLPHHLTPKYLQCKAHTNRRLRSDSSALLGLLVGDFTIGSRFGLPTRIFRLRSDLILISATEI